MCYEFGLWESVAKREGSEWGMVKGRGEGIEEYICTCDEGPTEMLLVVVPCPCRAGE